MKKLFKLSALKVGLIIGIIAMFAHFAIEMEYFHSGPFSRNGFLRELELQLLDTNFQSRQLDPLPPSKVVIVAQDEKSIERFGLLPWSRSVIANLLAKLQELKPKVIGFDIIFSDEDKNSAFKTIKNFADDFNNLGFDKKDGSGIEQIQQSLMELQTKQDNIQNNLTEIQKTIRSQKTGKNLIAKPLRKIKQENKIIKKLNNKLLKQSSSINEKFSKYRDTLMQQVAMSDPDKSLAEQIKSNNNNIVMAYFTFIHEKEIKGLSHKELHEDFSRINKAAINSLYEFSYQDVGGQEITTLKPITGDGVIDSLKVPSIVGVQAPLQIFADASKELAYFNMIPDFDGPMRRIRAFFKHNNKLYPYLGLKCTALYFEGGIYPLPGELEPNTLGGINIRDDLPNIQIDKHGSMLINYYSNPQTYFPTISAVDIIEGNVEKEEIEGKIVLLGATATGTFDQRITPFSNFTPGIYIHASAIQNMVDHNFLERPEGMPIFELLFMIILAIALSILFKRLSVYVGAIVSVAIMLGLYALDHWVIFPSGLWMQVVIPIVQTGLTYIGITIFRYLTEEREKRHIRRAFQFYMTKSVVDEMLKDTGKLQLGGERKELTVLFSDIRGFTSISERLTPEELTNLLNEYLTPMTNLVFKYEGTLDKYMGDAIMAIFGAPVFYEDHAARGCRVALEMMAELKVMQEGWKARGVPPIDIGIGLNTGEMSVGNMGSEIRFDYTVMGDNVNLGSRLEGINKQYKSNIIISEYTYEEAKKQIIAREMDSVRVKGKKEPVKIYELLDMRGMGAETPQWISHFEHGITLYKEQKWDDAIAAFSTVKEERPNDYPCDLYIERCTQMKQNPPESDWDGVFTMTTK